MDRRSLPFEIRAYDSTPSMYSTVFSCYNFFPPHVYVLFHQLNRAHLCTFTDYSINFDTVLLLFTLSPHLDTCRTLWILSIHPQSQVTLPQSLKIHGETSWIFFLRPLKYSISQDLVNAQIKCRPKKKEKAFVGGGNQKL